MIHSNFIKLLCLFSLICIYSCQEDDMITEEDTTTEEYTESTNTDNDLNDIDALSRYLTDEPETFVNNRLASTCYSISVANNDAEQSDTLTIDFGDGCYYYGRYRKGKMVITYTGRYREANSVIETTFEDYYADGIKVDGTRTTTNNGTSDGKMSFSISVTDGLFTFADNTTKTWTSSRTRIIDLNGTEDDFSDDVISVYGTASSVNRYGVERDHVISEESPLVYNTSCKLEGGVSSRYLWMPVSGQKETTIHRATMDVTRLFDYGDGTCDREFTVTSNNVTYTFSL